MKDRFGLPLEVGQVIVYGDGQLGAIKKLGANDLCVVPGRTRPGQRSGYRAPHTWVRNLRKVIVLVGMKPIQIGLVAHPCLEVTYA